MPEIKHAARAAYEAHQSTAGLASNWGGLSDIEVKAWEAAATAALLSGGGARPAGDPPPGGGHTKP
jgi:hypothetical protein